MKIVSASSGKIGTCITGPKFFLKENIKLGEAALCFAKDSKSHKLLWLVGGLESMIDYISLAKSEGELDDNTSSMLLSNIDNAAESIPNSPIERLACAMGCDLEEMYEAIKLAQVHISAPISGIQNFSGNKPRWIEKVPKNAA